MELGNPREKNNLHENHACTLVLESCENNLARLFLVTRRTNALVASFENNIVLHSLGSELFQNAENSLIPWYVNMDLQNENV